MSIRYKDENGNWVTGNKAIETSIVDQSGNFESDNVEGALRELADKVAKNSDIVNIEAMAKANSSKIADLQQKTNNTTNTLGGIQSDLNQAKEDIEWLKANGGGGGGSNLPTIKSDFKDCAIDKGTDLTIPIFFSSPNMGNATLYFLVNNIQVDTTGIKQGNNNVKLASRYLTATDNVVSVYAKDRAGLVSNQLSWNIIVGGIDLTSTFDYTVDYGITDTIRIPYKIETGINNKIVMTMTIDGVSKEYEATNGDNFVDIAGSELGLGTHSVTMSATVDKYKSQALVFNIVIISTTELYLSSTFVNGSEFTYGVPISINYRLSKQSTEEFNVTIAVDGNTVKTQKIGVGSYYWTYTNGLVGSHEITITAISMDYSETKTLTLSLTIVEGEYTPVEDYKLGLLCDLNAAGKNNDDDNVISKNLWVDSSGNGHNGKLVNFNYGTNGFINDTLVCDNDAYVEIEWSPWDTNALTGSTIDIIYNPINSGIEDCRVLDYTQITDNLSTDEIKPFKGVFADILQSIPSSASSGTSSGKVNLDDLSGEIHLTWVLDRTNKFFKTYIDGVLCRIMFLTDSGQGVNKFYEDFSLDSHIFLNSTKGKNCGTNVIKRFRVYDHALTSDEVLQNHLANIKDLVKQKELYDFNYRNTTLPKMYLTGDITNMTPTQSVPMKIEYQSPDEEKYGASFNTGIQNNPVLIQGTSSLQYVRHNYTIYLKDEYGSDMYYNPYGEGSVADYVFCLKADYVESSHANNTGVAKFINDCLYDTKTPMQLENENCRTTINGFPIELYMNGEYLGMYNFNHDRYSYQSYGYDYVKYPNMLVYEINSNSNTSAGAFYRYGANAESSANVSEIEYYKRDFKLIYGNRTTDSDTYSEIKSLVEWVSVAEYDLFRETISEHFNKEFLFRYFLNVLFIGAVDSLGKNLKIFTVDGKVWYPQFYDLDTVLGIDNSGYLTIQPDVEIESGSYNTSNSNLWSKVWNYFNTELKEEWAKMRQDRFTLDNLMEYIYNQQIAQIPAKMYNDDAQVKYLEFGSLYTYCCHGNKEHQIRRWLRERIAYVDSMLGYFTSQDDQVTIRMNKSGPVSFSVTTYIPLYFSVKWSNATGGTQTIKMKRGETKEFSYNSTTSTDQEVIIYHAQYIKDLSNLSNLNPSSCILANALKLTNVEIHSPLLYNVNVTNNKYLRNINLRNCTALGTVTATGSSLDLSKCKYLQHCDIYNTNLTEVQLGSEGGSLLDIFYPKSVQTIQLIKQRLLHTIGLPYGNNGDEIPTSLYTVTIQECPNITKLNTSTNTAINSSFVSMSYCNNLTIRNALDLEELNFDGFYRLKNVVIENMYNLTSVGFNDLLPKGDTSTIQYIGMSNCPKLETLELNCTSNEYEITFADKAVLNLGGLFGLKSLTSNCVLKGIETIVVPTKLESMFFTNDYGEGYSSIKNIWVSSVCDVNTSGSTAKVTYVGDSNYSGIDFNGMNLKNIDLGALVNIPNAINFNIAPTTVNPHFNLNRDGETYPYLQPEGSIDLTNYTESLARFFDGVDLDKMQIICKGSMPQTDLSYCFYNATFSKLQSITTLLNKVANIVNLDYCFYKTTINNTSVISSIKMGTNSTMNYTFAECPNITTLNNITIPKNVVAVEGMFYKCPLTSINSMIVNVQGSIKGLFKGCEKLTSITTLLIPNVTDVESTFEGCINLETLTGFNLPTTCTNVSNLFKGCYKLTRLTGLNLGSTITKGDNWCPPNLTTVENCTINTDKTKFKNVVSLTTVQDTNITGADLSDLFNGCTKLGTLKNCSVTANRSLARAFKNCNLITQSPITVIKDSVTNIDEIFSGCTNITDISGMLFGSGITNATSWIPPNLTTANNVTIKNEVVKFNDCTTLTSCLNLNLQGVTSLNYFFSNCSNVTEISFNPNTSCSKITSMAACFTKCSKLSKVDVSIIPKTNTSTLFACFSWCSSLKSINLNIPDTCTNIQGIFQVSGVTDISGSTFGSGITNATNWIPPNLATADNVTIKNNVVNFGNCNTLLNCRNLTISNNVTTLEKFVYGCTSLSNFTFNKSSNLSNVISIKSFMCGNKLIEVLDFSGFNLTSLDIMGGTGENLGFIANTNVNTVNFTDCVFGNRKISWIWLTNKCNTQGSITFDFTNAIMPLINFNRMGWGSTAKIYFKFNGADFKYWTTFARMFATDATHINGVDFTDAKISHITDFSNMFNATGLPQANFIEITEDIVFPSTATNVEKAFYGCTKLTHIHSNWNNSYSSTITSTDCYSGCTGITHIDDENIISYDGDNGLDYLPQEWGGNGFTLDNTMIFQINVTSNLVNQPLRPIGVKSLLSIDYTQARVNWGDGSNVELLCVNNNNNITTHTYTSEGMYYVKAHCAFGNGYGAGFASALYKVLQIPKYQWGNKYTNLMYGFSGAPNLVYVDLSNIEIDTSTQYTLCNLFLNCRKLETIIWFKQKIKVSNNSSDGIASMFKSCSSLNNLDMSHFDISNVTNLSDMFNGCSSLSYLNITGWDFKNVTTVASMFSNVGLKTIDTSTWLNANNITNFANFCNGATSEYITLTFSGSMWAIMHTCKNVKHVTWKNCTVSIENYSFPSFDDAKNAEWQITFDNAVISAENGTLGVLNYYNHLTTESLMSVINALADRTGMESDTLTLGSAHLAKLTPEQIKIATDKNWTVV